MANGGSQTSDKEPASHLRVTWKAVATGSIIVALAALTVATVTAAVKDADTLSVVALALAVLAFVVQLIVFIVQAAAASRQELQITEIYGKTLAALSAVEEKSEGTRQAVASMSGRVLDAAIGKAANEAGASQDESGGNVTPPPIEQFADRVKEIVAEESGRKRSSSPRRLPKRLVRSTSTPERPRLPGLLEIAQSATPDDRERAIEAMTGLRGPRLGALEHLFADYKLSRNLKAGHGLRVINPISAPDLVERGLVERRRRTPGSQPLFVLTHLGQIAGGLLSPAGEGFVHSHPALEPIRAIKAQYDDETAERTRPDVMFAEIPVVDEVQSDDDLQPPNHDDD